MSTQDSTHDDDITSDEVREFFRKGGDEIPEDGIPLNLDEATKQRLFGRAERDKERYEQTPVDALRNTDYDPGKPSQGQVFSWAMELQGLGEITVTELDKSHYLKAVLNDVPVMLSVDLDVGDMEITVCSLSNRDMDIVYRALKIDESEAGFEGPAQLATRMYKYAVALQVLKVNDQVFPAFDSAKFIDMGIDYTAQKLREHVEEFIQPINWARWNALLTALRIFEAKLAKCNQAALDANFWTPAGAA